MSTDRPIRHPADSRPRRQDERIEVARRTSPIGPGDDGVVRLFGIHAVAAALANPGRQIGRLWLTENAEARLREALSARGAEAERVSPRDLDRALGADTVHQGALLETQPLAELQLAEMVRLSGGRPIVVLDQVTDPHNVGAIFRSAAVFGAAGVVMQRRHSPPESGTLAKSASGALEVVAMARVQNLARSLGEMKSAGCTLIGLDGAADSALDDLAWPRHPVLVLGAEGKGLRELTRQTCDVICRIATDGALASLNVSNAAAVALHLAYLHRKRVGKGGEAT